MGWTRKGFGALIAVVAAVGGWMPPTMARAEGLALVTNPVEHVNTLIGTGTGSETMGEINNFPGAALPFGMVQYSPDTTDTYAGYDFHNSRSTGFSMNHASAGCPTFGDIPVLPTTTPIGSEPWSAWETIAHDETEVGTPGYYAVRFPDTGVSAELTATTRTGVGRFRYPADGRPAILHVRSGGSLAGNTASSIQIGEDNATITGSATTGGFCGAKNSYTVYFATRVSRPFGAHGTFDGHAVHPGARAADAPQVGGWVEFPAGSVVEVHTAISYVSIDGARANLAAEGESGFDVVRRAAAHEWNAALSRIRVAGSNDDDMRTFYTSLYRSLLHPNVFNDVDGSYPGFDGAVRTVGKGHTQYANFSDWDTYRCLAALQALLFPRQAGDMAQSLVNDAAQSGALPRWGLANASTAIMTGDNPVPLIVGLYTFGGNDFDAKTALYYMLKAATEGGRGLGDYVERPIAKSYAEYGYLPQTRPFGSANPYPGASVTLEWSVDDFAIAKFAEALGFGSVATEFQRRAQFWRNLLNPSNGYLSPRDTAGRFAPGPGLQLPDEDHLGQEGFEEGNAEQYLWMVPHNVAGLVGVLGGPLAAGLRLDLFTAEVNAGPHKPNLWIGNEPNFGVPWLYNYIGQPWKTQLTVDRIRRSAFGPTPDGEPGNDDLGALSSWYVWAALGLYPATPGTSVLTVNTPIFDRAEITLPTGNLIRISAPGASAGQQYIAGLGIDGHPTDLTYLPESMIRTGGSVDFGLSSVPNLFWGSAPSSAPPSFDGPDR